MQSVKTPTRLQRRYIDPNGIRRFYSTPRMPDGSLLPNPLFDMVAHPVGDPIPADAEMLDYFDTFSGNSYGYDFKRTPYGGDFANFTLTHTGPAAPCLAYDMAIEWFDYMATFPPPRIEDKRARLMTTTVGDDATLIRNASAGYLINFLNEYLPRLSDLWKQVQGREVALTANELLRVRLSLEKQQMLRHYQHRLGEAKRLFDSAVLEAQLTSVDDLLGR